MTIVLSVSGRSRPPWPKWAPGSHWRERKQGRCSSSCFSGCSWLFQTQELSLESMHRALGPSVRVLLTACISTPSVLSLGMPPPPCHHLRPGQDLPWCGTECKPHAKHCSKAATLPHFWDLALTEPDQVSGACFMVMLLGSAQQQGRQALHVHEQLQEPGLGILLIYLQPRPL